MPYHVSGLTAVSRFSLQLCVLLPLSALSLTTMADDDAEAKAKKNQEASEQPSSIRLESVFVGDKEQPAISYFIPWQGIGAPDKLYWNVEQKHDNALDLVDRDILLRSIHFYGEMNLESADIPE